MAEKDSPVEIVKVLGRRRLAWGIEYLVELEQTGKEEWVPFRLLRNCKHLVSAYNTSNKLIKHSNSNSDLVNGVCQSDGDNFINNKPKKQQKRRQSFPPSSVSISAENGLHSISSHELPGKILLPKQSGDEVSKEPVRKKARQSKSVSPINKGKSPSKQSPSSEDKSKKNVKVTKVSSPKPGTNSPKLQSTDIKCDASKEKKSKVSKATSPNSVTKSPKDVSEGMKTSGISGKNGKKKTGKAVEQFGSSVVNSEIIPQPSGVVPVKKQVKLQKKNGVKKNKTQKPVTAKKVSKIVRKSMNFQRSKSSQDKAPKASEIKHGSTCKSNGKENLTKLKKPESKPNRGKGLIVKLASFQRKPLMTPEKQSSCSSKNSSAATSDSEGILYSLADAEVSDTSASDTDADSENDEPLGLKGKKLPLLSKKKLVLKLTDLKHDKGTSTGYSTPDSDHDSEVTFKHSPRKLLLKDSVRPKSKSNTSKTGIMCVKPMSKLCQSPHSSSVAPSTCQTPPRPTDDRPQREPSPSLGSTNDLPRIPPVVPILPNSPSPPRYDMLVKNLTSHYPNSRGVKRQLSSDICQEPVERRVSVRHSESAFKYKEIVVKKCQNYTQIWLFSQTKRKNALNPKVFQELITALHNAKFDDTRVVLLTGSGSVFCSGIDLHYLMSGEHRSAATQMVDGLREFVKAMIAFPKPIMAAVNGPAVGLGVAILPLCDVIYASDKASFYCPYTKLGQTPEGCSSYTFSQAMGLAMANELLLAGRKITAQEAYQIGLVSQVFWPTSMMQEVIPRLQQMASTSAKALEASKILMRGHLRGKLQVTVDTECHMLCDLWASSECQRAIKTYTDDDEDMMS